MAAKSKVKPQAALNKKAAATSKKLATTVDNAAVLKAEIAGLAQQLKEKNAQLADLEADYAPVFKAANKADEVTIEGMQSKLVAGAVANETTIDHEGIAKHMLKTKENTEILITLVQFSVKDVKAYLSPDLVKKFTTVARGDKKRTLKYISQV